MAERRAMALSRLVSSKGWGEACEGMREAARLSCAHGENTEQMLHGAYQVAAVESLIQQVEHTARETAAEPRQGVKLV